jgi:hypothetical protein
MMNTKAGARVSAPPAARACTTPPSVVLLTTANGGTIKSTTIVQTRQGWTDQTPKLRHLS